MLQLLCGWLRAGSRRQAIPPQFTARGIVPGKCRGSRLQFSAFFGNVPEPLEAKSVSYRGTAQRDKMPVSIRSPKASRRSFQ
jgi:hypothetical protein